MPLLSLKRSVCSESGLDVKMRSRLDRIEKLFAG